MRRRFGSPRSLANTALMRQPKGVRGSSASFVQLVAAAAVLVASVATPLHLSLVPHEICAQHGELVDALPGGPDHHPEPESTGTGADADKHDDCPVLLQDRQTLEAQGPKLPCAPLFTCAPARVPAAQDQGATSLAILDVAPKTSPPA